MTAARLLAVPLVLGLSVLAAGCGGGPAKPAAVRVSAPTLPPVESTSLRAAAAPTSASASAAPDPTAAELTNVDADMSSLDSSIVAIDETRSQSDG